LGIVPPLSAPLAGSVTSSTDDRFRGVQVEGAFSVENRSLKSVGWCPLYSPAPPRHLSPFRKVRNAVDLSFVRGDSECFGVPLIGVQ
jgi:hypothetical protein